MASLFALSVAVQWNDPDPLFWMGLYGLALVLAALGAMDRVPFWSNVGALVFFTLLFVAWVPSLRDSRPEAFTSFQMNAPGDEAPREAGGLLLCAFWSGVLTFEGWKRRGVPRP